MSLINSIIEGLIQGLTEFLPVSSSGHLALYNIFFGAGATGESNLVFTILLHGSTMIAVIIAFWKDIVRLFAEMWSLIITIFKGKFDFKKITPYQWMGCMMILSLLPLVFVVPLKDYVEKLSLYPVVIGALLIVNGIMLFVSDKLAKGIKSEGEIKPLDALFVGAVQAIAVLPGISRSGSTLTSGLLSGFKREVAVKFSFILALPVILAANIMAVKDLSQSTVSSGDIGIYIIGMAIAAITGYFAIKMVKWVVNNEKLWYFGVYCILIGIISVIASFIR